MSLRTATGMLRPSEEREHCGSSSMKAALLKPLPTWHMDGMRRGNQPIYQLHGAFAIGTIPKFSVDSTRVYWQNVFCCFNVRRYLSWIEGLTTNQYVGGSNPSRRTIYKHERAPSGARFSCFAAFGKRGFSKDQPASG